MACLRYDKTNPKSPTYPRRLKCKLIYLTDQPDHFQSQTGKRLPVDQKLTKIIASGWFKIVFLFGLENGEAQLDQS